MKLKINKACDLSSISVLPPHSRTRRSNMVPSGPQASQLRSQPSQQSFPQGFSPHPAFFSQISQNSFDKVLTSDLRFGSQERENSVKKASCLSQINITKEENQMPMSRSSANQMRKWNASPASEHRYQIREELEHRLGMIDTSINRFGMILDSVQSDVMQVSKGTKELLLETDGMRRRLISEDASLQLMLSHGKQNKGLEDIKTNLDGVMKSVSDQLSNILGSLKTLKQNSSVAAAIPLKYTGSRDTSERKQQPLKNPAMPSKVHVQSAQPPKTEMEGWNSVKAEQSMFTGRPSFKENKGKGNSCTQQERECRVTIKSNEEINQGFSCFLGEKERDTKITLLQEAKQETDRILRRATRQRRKYCNPIIIN